MSRDTDVWSQWRLLLDASKQLPYVCGREMDMKSAEDGETNVMNARASRKTHVGAKYRNPSRLFSQHHEN